MNKHLKIHRNRIWILTHCSSTSNAQKIFVTLQFVHPLTQKSFNLIKEYEKNIEKCLMIRMCLVMGDSTLVSKNIAHAIICCDQERLLANNGWMQNEIFIHPICFEAKLMEAMNRQARSKSFSKVTSTWIDGHLERAYPFATFAFIVVNLSMLMTYLKLNKIREVLKDTN